MDEELRFDWDRANIDHVAEHGITTGEVEQAMLGDTVEIKTEIRNGELRTTQNGQSENGRILTIVTMVRDKQLRVVTAWPASKKQQAFWKAAREEL